MKALRWHGTKKVSVDTVPDPAIIEPTDCIIQVTATAICGSDLHLYDGVIPTMEDGDILGHEFMGVVVETGSQVRKLRKGERVVVPFTIACGSCPFCAQKKWALCDISNPNAAMQRKAIGVATSGLFGYSHMYGGISGGQAEYVRVPYADVGPQRIPEGPTDEQVLFLSDIFPTAWVAAQNAGIQKGDTVAVWGCGPVGLLTQRCAWLQGAGRVIAIDEQPERLAKAAAFAKSETLDFSKGEVVERLREQCDGQGPHSCIDAVGMEAHGAALSGVTDKVKKAVKLQIDQPTALRQAIEACRKGGTVSVPGVYAGYIDNVPFGIAFSKGLTFKMGQTPVQSHLEPLLKKIVAGDIDPSGIITHRLPLSEAAAGYDLFSGKKENCIKVVLTP